MTRRTRIILTCAGAVAATAGLLVVMKLGPFSTVATVTTATEPLDRPMREVWPALNRWDDRLEREYSEFVARLGGALAARKCNRLDRCLRNPEANLLFEPADAYLAMVPDCADLPYHLRAYFAFKRKLPFGYVNDVVGRGKRDIRYAFDVVPRGWTDWRSFKTPRKFLASIGGQVHSGMYRTQPGMDGVDFYPVSIERKSVIPGAIFYDPNGHVAVVTAVRSDGVVQLIDGHPDGSLTVKRFGAAFVVGPARMGGGFKRFRPVSVVDGKLFWPPAAVLPGWDPWAQYDKTRREGQTFEVWSRGKLAMDGAAMDPIADLRDQVQSLCRDVSDRVTAVEAAIAAGLSARAHPPALPDNIYGTDGEWEEYSTPSRDARLKAAVRELHDAALKIASAGQAAPALAAFTEEASKSDCQYRYLRSDGSAKLVSFEDVLDRLFTISFDPYHCPELRWGAPVGPERSTCPDGKNKLDWYANEQRLRNRIDREYGAPTPLESGPEVMPEIDPRRVLAPPELPGARAATSSGGPRPR